NVELAPEEGETYRFRAEDFMPKPGIFDTVFVASNIITLGLPNIFISGRLPQDQENNLSIFMYLLKDGGTLGLFDSFMNIPDWLFEGYEFENPNFPLYTGSNIYKGDTVFLAINTLSTKLITYVSNVKTELNGPNPIFSGPPANVETNIMYLNDDNKVKVTGYFGAFSTRRAFVVSEDDYIID
ncbi:MAG: hypothetical protein FWG22_03300, partial [Prolixibacteraceae bacterium]|nr:hypothetical protein [Prolixibacteraceae bacterium]